MAATAPVLAIVLCRDESPVDALEVLRHQEIRPRRVIAVGRGEELAAARADGLVDEVLDAGTGTAAVRRAAERATGEEWLWLLPAGTAPEPGCLAALLAVAARDPDAAAIGPLVLDRDDPRLVVAAGLSTDSSGNRRSGGDLSEVDPALLGAAPGITEVLAVPAAGALLRREVVERLGGLDPELPLRGADLDLGWRLNLAGHAVVCASTARVRAPRPEPASADRAAGVRTFLVGTARWSALLGAPRLAWLALLRLVGFALLRRWTEARTEASVLTALLRGRLGITAARARRAEVLPSRHDVRGLRTGRPERLRTALRRRVAALVRARVAQDPAWGDPVPVPDEPPGGGGAEPVRRRGRRGGGPVVVTAGIGDVPSPVQRRPELLAVPVDGRRLLRALVLTPPLLLTAALLVFAVVAGGVLAEAGRFSTELHGGRLLPVADLGTTWGDYLAAWHPAAGGTAAPASPSLLVLALFGSVLGGPAVVVAGLFGLGVVLAGLTAYAATRALPVSRTRRALVAAAYALLPAVALSAVQGRLDVLVVHVLVPPVLAGIAAAAGPSPDRSWLATACLTALGLAGIGAFVPLLHLVLVALAVLGFVAVPAAPGHARRRAAGLAALVLLPVACLLPWPLQWVRHPELLLHGTGAPLPAAPAGPWLLALSPDGTPLALAGVLLVVGALGALLLAPSRRMLPGVVVLVAGWAAAVLVGTWTAAPIGGGPSGPGWAGAPLVLAAAGCCWMLLGTGRLRSGLFSARVGRRALPVAACLTAAGLLGLAASGALVGVDGPLRARSTPVDPALAAELREPGRLLDLGEPARLPGGARPRFGDADLAPVPSAARWRDRVRADLRSGDPERVRGALASAAARGVSHVATDDPRLVSAAGSLATERGRLPDGRVVLRLLFPSSPVSLLGPDLARQARTEPAPAPRARPLPVDAAPPAVAVRVTPGGVGRTLVLGVPQEPGWWATVDGRAAPLATAWGDQVAVPLPERAAEVRVGYTEAPRTALLIAQAAAILFTAVAALPGRVTARR
ncbi:glycosyltransferase [Saccharopolyspora cebuensis]|uniref:Glycosyltransferase n=1 Tax=Saccharopolyspora cebuensis TaxID=418759 RepID=A0ABV4CNH3_9PSEU